MTLTTPLYGLPYQTGSDRPCDASEVWCDFANILNSTMGGLKNTLDRIQPAVPVACVGYAGAGITIGSPNTLVIPFNTVFADTDRMVDFDFSTRVIFPRRPGIYTISAIGTIYPLGGTAIFQYVNSAIINTFTGFPLPYSTAGSPQVGAISNSILPNLVPGNPFNFQAQAVARITVADMNLSALNLGGFAWSLNPGGNDFVFVGGRLSVFYMRDA